LVRIGDTMAEVVNIFNTYILPNWELLISALGIIIEMIITAAIIIKLLLNGKLREGLKTICIEVEQMEGLTAAQKLQCALDKSVALCKKLGIHFNKTKIISLVENLITFSKAVNPPNKPAKVKVK